MYFEIFYFSETIGTKRNQAGTKDFFKTALDEIGTSRGHPAFYYNTNEKLGRLAEDHLPRGLRTRCCMEAFI